MTPSIKATLAFPFILAIPAFFVWLTVKHTALVTYAFLVVSVAVLCAALWYGLYSYFGGEEP